LDERLVQVDERLVDLDERPVDVDERLGELAERLEGFAERPGEVDERLKTRNGGGFAAWEPSSRGSLKAEWGRQAAESESAAGHLLGRPRLPGTRVPGCGRRIRVSVA
jgi:hypothetical protein